jgi:hypothetical protein
VAEEYNEQQAASNATGTDSSVTTAFMEVVSTVTPEGIAAVYASGFLITLCLYALAAKIAIVLQVIRKI